MSFYRSHRVFFFFNDTATTEIYTLPLHDALPISRPASAGRGAAGVADGPDPAAEPELVRPALHPRPDAGLGQGVRPARTEDRKSTRLNSSHLVISYAVFCLKKKNETNVILRISTF